MAIMESNKPLQILNQVDADYMLQVAASELKQLHNGISPKGLD